MKGPSSLEPVASWPVARLVALAWLPIAGGCGASIQAVYEGDVRFEHCMALDAQPSVQARFRRACWVEWVTHYTYGQTRDRVVHAQVRIQQLAGTSDFASPEANDRTLNLDLQSQSSALSAGEEAGRCEGECKAVHEDCSRECQTPSCEKSCSVGLRHCMRRCG